MSLNTFDEFEPLLEVQCACVTRPVTSVKRLDQNARAVTLKYSFEPVDVDF